MSHPKLTEKLPKTKTQRYIELLALSTAFGSLAFVILKFGDLPSEIPVHFNLAGEPNRMGSKGLLYLLPAINILLTVALLWITKFPHKFNYIVTITKQNMLEQYRVGVNTMRQIALVCSLLLAYLTISTVQVGMERTSGLNPFIMGFLGLLLFAVIIKGVMESKRKA